MGTVWALYVIMVAYGHYKGTKMTDDNISKLKTPIESRHLRADTYKKYQPRAVTYYIKDKDIPTYFLRVYPSGKKVYAVRKRLGGVGDKVFVNLGSTDILTEKEARHLAIKNIAMIQEGINPNEERERLKVEAKKSKTTYGDLAEEYFVNQSLKPNTIQNHKDIVKSLGIWDKTIGNITQQEIYQAVLDSRKEDKETKAKMITKYMNSIFEYAVNSDVIEENVVKKVKAKFKFKSAQQKENHIPITELDNFLTTLNNLSPFDFKNPTTQFQDYDIPSYTFQPERIENEKLLSRTMRDYILYLLVTGSRKTEASLLKWKDIDFEKGTITYPDTKGNRPFTFPMTFLTYNMMKWRKDNVKSKDNWVFPNAYDTGRLIETKATLIKLSRLSGLERLTNHDLRRTFVTYSRELGMDLADSGMLVNHSGKNITQGYDKTSMDRKRSLLEEINQYINDNSKQSLGAFIVHWYGGDSRHFDPTNIGLEEENIDPEYY